MQCDINDMKRLNRIQQPRKLYQGLFMNSVSASHNKIFFVLYFKFFVCNENSIILSVLQTQLSVNEV